MILLNEVNDKLKVKICSIIFTDDIFIFEISETENNTCNVYFKNYKFIYYSVNFLPTGLIVKEITLNNTSLNVIKIIPIAEEIVEKLIYFYYFNNITTDRINKLNLKYGTFTI